MGKISFMGKCAIVLKNKQNSANFEVFHRKTNIEDLCKNKFESQNVVWYFFYYFQKKKIVNTTLVVILINFLNI